jgi:predicted transposase/invertase (TIGR01784 family)
VKTDPIFYRLFQTSPNVFFELLGYAPASGFAVSEGMADTYEFRSVEIKQTAFRIDGIFIPLPGADQQPIFFVEVQFQKDASFYFRFFSEIMLYLRQYEPANNWQAVVIYPSRSIEPPEPQVHQALFASSQVQRIYLDELEITAEPSLGVSIVKLVVEAEERTTAQARELIAKVRREIGSPILQLEIIELIEIIIVYKFPQKSRQELAAMLGLGDLKQTKLYQEAEQEGEQKAKLEAVPRLLKLGLNLEQISEALSLSLEEVRQAAQQE